MQAPLTKYYNQNKKKTITKEGKLKEKVNNTTKDKITKEQAEEKLISFDLDARYGPCKGLKRSERYEIAVKYRLNPPKEMKELIDEFQLEKSYYDRYL